MNDPSQIQGGPTEKSLHRRSLMVGVILVVSFFGAGAVRLYNIESPKPYFYPSRQYESFLIARSFYFESIESVPDWQRQIAKVNKLASVGKGPPVTEYLVCLVYHVAGGENHWACCLICSGFWLMGGIFVFLIAKKFSLPVAAAIATAFYLLFPFGIFMTRSFQPESLMMMMFLASIYTMFNYYENQSTKRLLIMAVVSGLAILVKSTVIFPIWTAFIAGGICKNGFRRTIFSLHHLVFELIGIMPGFVYYFFLVLFNPTFRMVAGGVYGPKLLLGSYFWTGWLSQLGDVAGFIPLAGAIIGVFLVRNKLAKSMLTGLAVGYFVYGLIFAADAPTQGYKQLHVSPIVALAMSPVIAFFLNVLGKKNSRLRRATIVVGVFLLIVLFGLLASIKVSAHRSENKYIKPCLAFAYRCFGLKPEYVSQISSDYTSYVEMAEEIGQAVNHSDKTITLASAESPLWYYGQYAGQRWPWHRHWPNAVGHNAIGTGAKWKKYQGLTAEEFFEQRYSTFLPEYFIVTSFEDFEKQETLREFLARKSTILVQNDRYMIFDLTEPRQ